MLIAHWLLAIALLLSLTLSVVFAAWLVVESIDVGQRARRRREYAEDLWGALKHGQPTWEQLVEMARLRRLSAAEADRVVRELWRDAVTGRQTGAETYVAVLDGYISEYKQVDPFEGLPVRTRVHLERLRQIVGGNPALLEPLVTEIRELASIYERDKRNQRRYTAWGFFVGVFGFLLAVVAYVYPLRH